MLVSNHLVFVYLKMFLFCLPEDYFYWIKNSMLADVFFQHFQDIIPQTCPCGLLYNWVPLNHFLSTLYAYLLTRLRAATVVLSWWWGKTAKRQTQAPSSGNQDQSVIIYFTPLIPSSPFLPLSLAHSFHVLGLEVQSKS